MVLALVILNVPSTSVNGIVLPSMVISPVAPVKLNSTLAAGAGANSGKAGTVLQVDAATFAASPVLLNGATL